MKPNEHNHSLGAYLRPVEAARYTSISESTLAKLRMRHNRQDGPAYLKISGCVVYRRDDLDAWMNAHEVEAHA